MSNAPRTNRERSPWAVISILIIIVLFGLFWFWQKQKLQQQDISVAPSTTNPVVIQKSQDDSLFDFSTLEANVVNTTIPYFSEAF